MAFTVGFGQYLLLSRHIGSDALSFRCACGRQHIVLHTAAVACISVVHISRLFMSITEATDGHDLCHAHGQQAGICSQPWDTDALGEMSVKHQCMAAGRVRQGLERFGGSQPSES